MRLQGIGVRCTDTVLPSTYRVDEIAILPPNRVTLGTTLRAPMARIDHDVVVEFDGQLVGKHVKPDTVVPAQQTGRRDGDHAGGECQRCGGGRRHIQAWKIVPLAVGRTSVDLNHFAQKKPCQVKQMSGLFDLPARLVLLPPPLRWGRAIQPSNRKRVGPDCRATGRGLRLPYRDSASDSRLP